MKNLVTLSWICNGRQHVEVPDDIDVSDRKAALDCLTEIWEEIPFPDKDNIKDNERRFSP